MEFWQYCRELNCRGRELGRQLRSAWGLVTQPLRRVRNASLGTRGERAAARHLRRLGYRIVAHSQRERGGELDLIAVDRRTIVFVEVKTRSDAQLEHPAAAVDEAKQRRLTHAALRFLKRHNLLECAARFDVIAIDWPPHARKPHIEHFQNAFEAVGCGQFFC